MPKPRRLSAANAAAKRGIIAAYFEDLEARALFASALREQGHPQEAMTLCCCYIDGLANLLYHDSDKSAFNFVRLLKEHGRQSELTRVCPLVLTRWLEANRPKLAPTARKLSTALGEDLHRIMSDVELSAAVSRVLTKQEAETLAGEMWRAAIAFVAYTHLRVPSVHSTGSSGGVIVGSGGPSTPVRISFDTLFPALLAAIGALRDLSLTTNKWFGHDEIL